MPKLLGKLRRGKFNPLNRRKNSRLFTERKRNPATNDFDRRANPFVAWEREEDVVKQGKVVGQNIQMKDAGEFAARDYNSDGKDVFNLVHELGGRQKREFHDPKTGKPKPITLRSTILEESASRPVGKPVKFAGMHLQAWERNPVRTHTVAVKTDRRRTDVRTDRRKPAKKKK
ncbi:MAG: hypothetical protein ABH986_01840, partial [archaeon]